MAAAPPIPPPLTSPPAVDVSNFIIAIVAGSFALCIVIRLSIHYAHVYEWESRRPEEKPADSALFAPTLRTV